MSPHNLLRGKSRALDQTDMHARARQDQRRYGARRSRAHDQSAGVIGRVRGPARCSWIRTRDSCRARRRCPLRRAVFGMKSMSHAGSWSSRLMVGGSTPRVSARRSPPRRRRRWRPADGRSSTWSTTRDIVGVPAEHATHAARLDRVVQLRRGAVVVDVADFLGSAVRAFERRFRCSARSRRRRDPSAPGGRRHRSTRSLRSARTQWRRAPGRGLRARARTSTRPRRARSRRARDRTAATPPPGRSL